MTEKLSATMGSILGYRQETCVHNNTLEGLVPITAFRKFHVVMKKVVMATKDAHDMREKEGRPLARRRVMRQ